MGRIKRIITEISLPLDLLTGVKVTVEVLRFKTIVKV